MAKPKEMELGDGTLIPILYEDRSVLAIDKPAGWMLAPESWDRTGRNLHLAILSSIQGRDFWARSRNIKYLRFIHRLDAGTTGVLLLAKTPGALRAMSDLFENQQVEKIYLAVAQGCPAKTEWRVDLALSPDPAVSGRMRTVPSKGRKAESSQFKLAETHFRVLQSGGGKTLVEARPVTGRTHQIRVHLAVSGHPIVGDAVYGEEPARREKSSELALRAYSVRYRDPFQKRTVWIEAPSKQFAAKHGFDWVPDRRGESGRQRGRHV